MPNSHFMQNYSRAILFIAAISTCGDCSKKQSSEAISQPVTLESVLAAYPAKSIIIAKAEAGLRVRKGPSQNSQITHIYPSESVFEVIGQVKKLESINDKPGIWLKISHPYGLGYVYSAYVSSLNLPKDHVVVQGHWQYPGEGYSEGFRICLRSIVKKENFCSDKSGAVSEVNRKFEQDFAMYQIYHLIVPRDTYYAYARTNESHFLAIYDEYAKCQQNELLHRFDCERRCPSGSCPECASADTIQPCRGLLVSPRRLIKVMPKPNEQIVNHIDPIDYYEHVEKEFPDFLRIP